MDERRRVGELFVDIICKSITKCISFFPQPEKPAGAADEDWSGLGPGLLLEILQSGNHMAMLQRLCVSAGGALLDEEEIKKKLGKEFKAAKEKSDFVAMLTPPVSACCLAGFLLCILLLLLLLFATHAG